MKKQERNAVYKKALEQIQNGKNSFCCPAIKFAWTIINQEKYPGDEDGEELIQQFTEFIAYKPMNITTPWWFSDANGNAERKMILENCIKQTA